MWRSPASARRSGRRGRGFKSPHPDSRILGKHAQEKGTLLSLQCALAIKWAHTVIMGRSYLKHHRIYFVDGFLGRT